jgi:hypothetical protein
MHEPQAVRSLWIGNEHTGQNRSGGDARPIASPMRRACTRPQPATAARRWSPAARSALGRLQSSCSCAPRGRARRALCGPGAPGTGSGQIPWAPGRQRVGPGGAGSRAPDGRRRIRSAGQHAGTAPPRCCLWGCPRPRGDRTHGKSGANDNPAQSACNWHHEPEICHSELRRWRRCTG